jgi:sodium-dependent dicarboxylate transporter 2/3/5
VLALLMSELTSHTAATNMVGPLAITTAIAAGMSPVPVAVGVALSASLGFMLPVSTPPNAIVYASGYIPITKMIKAGFVIDLVGIAAVTIPLVLLVVSVVVAL